MPRSRYSMRQNEHEPAKMRLHNDEAASATVAKMDVNMHAGDQGLAWPAIKTLKFSGKGSW